MEVSHVIYANSVVITHNSTMGYDIKCKPFNSQLPYIHTISYTCEETIVPRHAPCVRQLILLKRYDTLTQWISVRPTTSMTCNNRKYLSMQIKPIIFVTNTECFLFILRELYLLFHYITYI